MVASILIAEGFLWLQLFRRQSFCMVSWDSLAKKSLLLHVEVKGEIFLSLSIVRFSSMLSTGCCLAVFFVAAFKKF